MDRRGHDKKIRQKRKMRKSRYINRLQRSLVKYCKMKEDIEKSQKEDTELMLPTGSYDYWIDAVENDLSRVNKAIQEISTEIMELQVFGKKYE